MTDNPSDVPAVDNNPAPSLNDPDGTAVAPSGATWTNNADGPSVSAEEAAQAFCAAVGVAQDLMTILVERVVDLNAMAGTLLGASDPAAISNGEYEAWLRVKELTDAVREDGALEALTGDLREAVQTHLWSRMEEVGVPSRKFPLLGVQFIQTHAIYPSLNRQAIEAQGLSTEAANAVIIEWLEHDMNAPETVDREPRVNWARLRGKEYVPGWLGDGVLLPDLINAVPKPTVSIRKL